MDERDYEAMNRELEQLPFISKARVPLPITNQKLWVMAKLIANRQREAKDKPTDKVDWNMLEGMWFDWLEEELFGDF